MKYFLSNFFLIWLLSLDFYISARKFITQTPIKTKWNTYEFNLIDVGVGAGGNIYFLLNQMVIYINTSLMTRII